MIVTFFSNFLNHHQLSFCLEMGRLLGDKFKFVATARTPQERLDMGYHDMNDKFPFVLRTYDDSDGKQMAASLAMSSDVVVVGAAPEDYVRDRMKKNKLTFRYSERPFKEGFIRAYSYNNIKYMIRNHTTYNRKKLYLLCASGYASGDYSMMGAYANKCYKWGYFTEFISYDVTDLMNKKKHSNIRILWCGRFLKWKHPEYALSLAEYLIKMGISFHIDMIGNGVLEDKLINAINYKGLNNYISVLGSMSPENVRRAMETSNIFLFTSDYNEGWGAVLNEAMNSGCAIVASHAVGSVPFLLKHNENGLIYRNGNMEDFYGQVKKLIDNTDFIEKLGKSAYQTIKNNWNGKCAADRLLALSDSLISDGKDNNLFEHGPCSKANNIKQWNMYKHCLKKY